MSIDIKIKDRNGEVKNLKSHTDVSLNLMEFIKENGYHIEGTCAGLGTCSSCHIYVDSDTDLKEMSIIEDMMLDDVGELRKSNSRLSCQIHVDERIDGIEITISPKNN